MLNDAIKILCWNKIDELLKEHFTNTSSEVLDPRYTLDYPLKVAAEMKDYLADLWATEGHQSGKAFEDLMGAGRLNNITYESYLDMIKAAQKEALKITLWEKITHTNHEDVMIFQSILRSCTREILELLVKDFLNE